MTLLCRAKYQVAGSAVMVKSPISHRMAAFVRVYVLLSDVNPGMPLFLARLLKQCPYEIVEVGRVRVNPGRSKVRWLKRQLAFWGVRGAFRLGLRVAGQWLAGITGAKRAAIDLGHLCQRHNVPTTAVRDPNADAFVRRLEKLNIDVLVSFQSWVLRSPLLSVTHRRSLNIHTGLLPGFRGQRPIFQMMKAGLSELAVTVHTMTPRIDAGQVVHVERFPNRPDSTVMENNRIAYQIAADALTQALKKVDLGSSLQEGISEDSPYFSHPSRGEVKGARRRGLRLY